MGEAYSWYQKLAKPSWAPPSWLFGPVWTVLYIIIAVTLVVIFYKAVTHKIPWRPILPFVFNLIFNFAFTPLQFGLKHNLLAAVDIVFVLLTLIWFFAAIWPYMSIIVYANIPYLLWVSFATVLQLTITYLNR